MSHSFDGVQKTIQQNKNFLSKWFSTHQFGTSDYSLEQIINSIKTLEDNSIFSNEIIVVYKTQNFKPLYVSNNVEKILGYSQDEFLSWDEGAFFKIGAFNQPTYYPNLLKWEKHFRDNSSHKKVQVTGRGHFCGVQYHHKDGTTRRFLLRQKAIFEKGFQLPAFDLLYFEDISHLVKGEDYWILFETFNDASSFSKFYRPEGMDNYPITAREKEVLLLIAAGKSTKEVANELHISPETVGQHRKNMIKKMMAKDTSALIQLCKMCEII